jgi:hypothetical protein
LPTALLARLILTCIIDAYERRDVTTLDILRAFLQAKPPKEDKDMHVVLDGRMAELLAKISPETYRKYVHKRRGQKLIYCKLNVALYGTLKAALLFWQKLTKSLKLRGFIINPYDWCIANKTINGKQCTIVWNVDDLKISHRDSSVIDKIVESLNGEYEKVGKMTVRQGKTHDYLGMTLDFSEDGKFIISMENYLNAVLGDLRKDMSGTALLPAAEHLFKTQDNAEKMSQEQAAMFHHVTLQLLYTCKRGRPDLQTAVSFLCTRVWGPDQDDYKKLAPVIKYIRWTKFLCLTMEADWLDLNHWYIDGAFAVHDDMRSHTGSFMTFGKGMMNDPQTSKRSTQQVQQKLKWWQFTTTCHQFCGHNSL